MKKFILLPAFILIIIRAGLFAQDGALDSLFGTNGLVKTTFEGYIAGAALQADGKIVVAGYVEAGLYDDFALARFNPDGSLDDMFGLGGIITTDASPLDNWIFAIAIQPDGKIVAAGFRQDSVSGWDFAVARYDTDGFLDNGFGVNGMTITDFSPGTGDDEARAVAIQPDGKIVLAGYAYPGTNATFAMARYNQDGSLDESFGTEGKVVTDFGPGDDVGRGIVIQPDGKIVVGGYTDFLSGNDNFGLARYNPDGTLDDSFGGGGLMITDFIGFEDRITSLELQQDGKIVASGYSRGYLSTGSTSGFALARYNEDGFLDENFGEDGLSFTIFGPEFSFGLASALQADGKIVVAGWTDNAIVRDFALARYNSDGILDEDFGAGGLMITDFNGGHDAATSVVLQPDGKIVLAGTSEGVYALARYLSELSVGVLDFSVLKNSVWIYPNPVSENATLKFTLKKKESLTIRLADAQGRIWKTFMENEMLDAGEHFQAIALPEGLPEGVYFIVLSTAEGRVSIKIMK